MRELQLQGYDTLVPNEVYARKEPSTEPPRTNILTIQRGHLVTSDEVLKYIQKVAGKFYADFVEKHIEPEKRSYESLLEKAIDVVPDEFIEALVQGEDHLMSTLRILSSAPNKIQRENPYVLSARLINFQQQQLDNIETLTKIRGSDRYVLAAQLLSDQDDGLNLVQLSLKTHQGGLIDQKIASFLIEHETSKSHPVDVSFYRAEYPKKQLIELIPVIYGALQTPQDFERLRDISLDIVASSAMADFDNRCIRFMRSGGAIAGLAGLVSLLTLLEGQTSREPKDKNLDGPLGPELKA